MDKKTKKIPMEKSKEKLKKIANLLMELFKKEDNLFLKISKDKKV